VQPRPRLERGLTLPGAPGRLREHGEPGRTYKGRDGRAKGPCTTRLGLRDGFRRTCTFSSSAPQKGDSALGDELTLGGLRTRGNVRRSSCRSLRRPTRFGRPRSAARLAPEDFFSHVDEEGRVRSWRPEDEIRPRRRQVDPTDGRLEKGLERAARLCGCSLALSSRGDRHAPAKIREIKKQELAFQSRAESTHAVKRADSQSVATLAAASFAAAAAAFTPLMCSSTTWCPSSCRAST